jgi:hypothetical protein
VIKGAQVVQAIDLILDQELHRLIKQREALMVERIGDLIAPLGVRPGSTRLALAMRAVRKLRPEDANELISYFRSRIGVATHHLTDEVIWKLMNDLRDRIGDDDSELGMERSRLATISTVLRPLSTRWPERWRAERIDLDHAALAREAAVLLNREISSLEDLASWFNSVHELFKEFVLFRPNPTMRNSSGPQRPIGTVNVSNERLYERNWLKWTRDNSAAILSRSKDLAEGKSPEPYRSNYSRPSSYSTRTAPDVSSFVYATSKSGEIYKVTLSPSGSDGMEATKSWNSKDSLISDLRKWVETRANVWGSDATLLDFSLEEVNQESTTSARQKTPEETIKSILSLLS